MAVTRRLTPLYDWRLTEAEWSGSETSTAVSRPVNALVRRHLNPPIGIAAYDFERLIGMNGYFPFQRRLWLAL